MQKACNILFLSESKFDQNPHSYLASFKNLALSSKFINHPSLAIEFLENCSVDEFPSLLVIDIDIPIMDGFEFAEYFFLNHYYNHPNTVVVLMSNAIESSLINQDTDNPVITHILAKSISVESFAEIISPYVNKKAIQKEVAFG